MPLTTINLLYFLEYYARLFRKDMAFVQIPASVPEKEALLVDFINFSGVLNCVDYAMHTSYLKEDFTQNDTVAGLSSKDKNRAMELIKLYAKRYIPSAIDSIKRHSHMNAIDGKVNLNQAEATEVIKRLLIFIRKQYKIN